MIPKIKRGPPTKFITLVCEACQQPFERLLRAHNRKIGQGAKHFYCPICRTHRRKTHPCLRCGTQTYNPKYCTQTCSALVNNKTAKRRLPEGRCAICDKAIRKSFKYCRPCRARHRVNYAAKTLAQLKRRGSRNVYHTCIRQHAKQVAIAAGLLKACRVCGYSIYVECCHIKPVKNFPPDATLKTINAVDNLIGLCPNHHIELDLGLLNLVALLGVEPSAYPL